MVSKPTQTYKSKLVILTTGTYMDSKVMGFRMMLGLKVLTMKKLLKNLSRCLKRLRYRTIFCLKTGTPPRILKESIDYSKTTLEINRCFLHLQ